VLLLAVAVTASAAGGQGTYFGQNKIQYRDFDWQVLRGPRVDVYYYPAEERIARLALVYAEESIDTLALRLTHQLSARVPLIVYASHSDFEQTNVLPFVPPEGVLGVTEFLKRRVTIPFRGSYSEFRHTVRHELVHVFQLSLAQQRFTLRPRATGTGMPLWFTEGLAEYLSSPQDSRDEMVMRDVTLSGQMPSITQLNGITSPVVYPIGGDLLRFLGRRYGDWRINLLHSTLHQYRTFDDALAGVYGRSSERLSDEWRYDLRQRYYPAVAERRPLGIAGRQVVDVAMQPVAVASDTGIAVAYLSPRTGYTNIYSAPLDAPGRPRVVVAGERTPEFESFHAYSSRLDAREGVLVFGSKFGDRDALFFWSVSGNRVVGRYRFDSIVGVVSPSWSSDGRRVAFSGLSVGGISDLYVFEMAGGRLARVTSDVYEDTDPTWLPGDRSIAFSSDRGDGGGDGSRNIYVVDVDGARADGARVRPLTRGRWLDESPRWDAEEGRILFASDRDGTFNIYSVDTLGRGRRETRLDGGAFGPAPVPGDQRLLVGGFSDLGYSVFALAPDTAARRDTFALAAPAIAAADSAWQWTELADARALRAESHPYRPRFTLDFAAGGGSSAPGWGTAQGGQVYFGDLLGDHAVAASFALYGTGGVKSLFNNFNADVFYLNQSRRLNWGVGIFRLAGLFVERDFTQVYSERTGGVYGTLRYPLSRYTRVEAQTRLEHSNRDDFGNALVRGPQQRRGVLASNFLSAIGDNTLWSSTGPIDGGRWNLTGGVVSDVTHGVFENWVGTADVRRYLRTSMQSAVALRGYGYVSEGVRPRAMQVGGPWLLRGYPMFSLDGTRAWVGSAEWRFPLANFVTLGLPVGAIRLPQLQGAVFADAGQSWYGGAYDRRVPGAYGGSLRTALIPGLVLRLDVGRRYSVGGGGPDDAYRRRFADFFIGYNY
jgi:hypothetical protein